MFCIPSCYVYVYKYVFYGNKYVYKCFLWLQICLHICFLCLTVEMKTNRYNVVHRDSSKKKKPFLTNRCFKTWLYPLPHRQQKSMFFLNYVWVACILKGTLKMVSSNNQDGLCMSITLYIRFSRNYFTAISSGLNFNVKDREGFVYGYQLMP